MSIFWIIILILFAALGGAMVYLWVQKIKKEQDK
ncbi:hypothetical protein Oweho_1096 [Owenweeksia hongkongensis DSM 17368]|uniref:Uncharacterized protein n=1 Tax=Owenweeksia hongkongensis (strain DSM 17368 / CIP 108786 / JCM 12287 / NRRL B-23963 / UST20020801) TaxID=926562 RepID=G8R4L3_OWEHD|nr:hypothetical protein Oweho_1096 [Owenweeksia hongkongensis DSM 17368]